MYALMLTCKIKIKKKRASEDADSDTQGEARDCILKQAPGAAEDAALCSRTFCSDGMPCICAVQTSAIRPRHY